MQLAPFCVGKKPQIITPIIKEGEPMQVVFASTYISQVARLQHGCLEKIGSRGTALPGMLPNPDHDSLWPLTKYHAQNWPLVLRQLDSTRSKMQHNPIKI